MSYYHPMNHMMDDDDEDDMQGAMTDDDHVHNQDIEDPEEENNDDDENDDDDEEHINNHETYSENIPTEFIDINITTTTNDTAPQQQCRIGTTRKGSRWLTRFEKARMLGIRTLQLSMNSPTTATRPETMTDPYEIAQLELKTRVIPFMIRRWFPDKSYEDWNISELEFD